MKRVTDQEILNYLERWRDNDNFTDFNLFLDRGYDLTAAMHLKEAGALVDDHTEADDPRIAKAINSSLKRYSQKRYRKDIDECLKNTEIWINPDTNEHAFIPQVDVDYFITQLDLTRSHYRFSHGYDSKGKEYSVSRLDEGLIKTKEQK